ncbi:MAG: tetratricopeptide repeat protein [Salibacteraceae bacterium]
MQFGKFITTALIVLPLVLPAQMTMTYDNDLLEYQRGLQLYEKQLYGAAKDQFEQTASEVSDQNSEISANAHFFIASCALELFHKDAEFLLKEFIRNHSTSTRINDAWFLLGEYNYRKKDWNDAIDYFNEIDPDDLSEPRKSEYLFKKGFSYFQKNDYDKAADQFFQMKEASSIYYAPGVYYFAHINYELGNYATALKSFKSLDEHPQFGEVVPYYIVQVYHFQEKYDNLIAYGKPFLKQDEVKRKAEISRLVGEALYHREAYDEAIPFLEDFMASRLPKQKEDFYVLGYACYRANLFDKAAEQFSKISYSDDSLGQNASYHLGETYLKASKKSYARNAYRTASRMDFDPKMKEDALFKYAQLSYELSYDPYDGAIAAFKEYIDVYPNSERTQEAFDYLVNIYLTSKNYDAALSSIDEYDDPDIRLQEAYQRIAYNKAVSLYQDRLFRDAINYFKKSLKYTQSKELTALGNYWIAEAQYNRNEFDQAVESYKTFIYTPGAVLTPYFNLANYNIGYACFQQDKFNDATSWYRRFTSYNKEKDEVKLNDANLRLGDCYFMLNDYPAAFDYYEKAARIGKADQDYALYQLAMTQGLLKNLNAKLESLEKLTNNFPESHYLVAAYYEIGRVHIALGNDEEALANLNKVVSDFPGSIYVRKAMVSIGQTYYNQQRDDEALKVFLSIIEKYKTFDDTREALIGVQNIYTDQGRVEKYEDLISSLEYVSISDMALDSINYEAAEIQYFNGQCKEAVAAFDKYLNRFEKGVFHLNSKFYRAECLYKMGQQDAALEDYEFVADQPQNKFSESALLKAARINFSRENYPDALAYYKRLSMFGHYKDNLLEAEIGQMRCNFKLNNFQGAIANAFIVLENEKIDSKLETEADLVIAKSNLELESPMEADLHLKKVMMSGSPSQAAEATYLSARVQFNMDSLDSAEVIVFDLVENHQSQSFWMAKGLILLSDIYVTRGDLFQARATLESIIDNYTERDELRLQAEQKLATIEDLEHEDEVEEEPELEIEFEQVTPTIDPSEDTLEIEEVTPKDTLKNE